MGADFSNLSKFNPDTGFKSVRIGAGSPVLEVELNEMQDISENRYKQFVYDQFGDGIKGNGSYIYTNGYATVSNDSAFIKGNIIDITSLKIKANEGDKIYLKVWEQTLGINDEIKYKGNQQETKTIENYLLDDRVGYETSRRIQVQYDLTTSNTSKGCDYLFLGVIKKGAFHLQCPIIRLEYNKRHVDYITSKGSQSVFALSGTYKMNTGAVLVFVDGKIKVSGKDYYETSNTSITFNEPLTKGQQVLIIYDRTGETQFNLNDHSTQHTKKGSDPIDIKDLADSRGLLEELKNITNGRVIDGGFFNDDVTDDAVIYDCGTF